MYRLHSTELPPEYQVLPFREREGSGAQGPYQELFEDKLVLPRMFLELQNEWAASCCHEQVPERALLNTIP